MPRPRVTLSTEPMYATVGKEVPPDGGWTFEPKFDGMRVLAHVGDPDVHLMTRNGKDKRAQFPEIVTGLERLAERVGQSMVLDGEVVALDSGGAGSFQALQQRMHLRERERIAALASSAPTALLVFDLLQLGDDPLVTLPWRARRHALERLLGRAARTRTATIRLTESVTDASALLDRARRGRWEGIIAKRADAPYVPGARSRDWLKLKLEYRAEFVVGGFTEPRNSREHIGALLLGYYDDAGDLVYAGHTGGGFDRQALQRMLARLAPLERATSPFVGVPRTNQPAHWVRPKVVVEVKFAEWTGDGRLRQPIYVGTRDDKSARDVVRESTSMQEWRMPSRKTAAGKATARKATAKNAGARKATAKKARPTGSVIDQLVTIERAGGDGDLRFETGKSLHVSSLDKIYFPGDGMTKGDVMRYYASVAPALLPFLRDRPLALTRYPEGIGGHTFYQQNALKGVPEGVRVETIAVAGGDEAERFVGDDLRSLLYLVQMGTIVIHSWFSRTEALDEPDLSLIDLDPGEGVGFGAVVDVARVVREVTDRFGLDSVVKTSGSRGIHIGVPLPAGTSYEDSAELARRIADRVMEERPALATLERRIARRPAGSILVDVNQNARGKTMVAPYSLRAGEGATVSAPLGWKDVGGRLTMERFTARTMPRRLDRTGDLWGDALQRRNPPRAIAAVLGKA